MVIEASEFNFKKIVDSYSLLPQTRSIRLSPLPLPSIPQTQEKILKDISNLKQRMMIGSLPDKFADRRSSSAANNSLNLGTALPQKDDIRRIKVELGRQIQRDKGRSRIENIEFFHRLEKKEMCDMRLEAKTILLSIKKENRMEREDAKDIVGAAANALAGRSLLRKNSELLTSDHPSLRGNPISLSTLNLLERLKQKLILATPVAQRKHNKPTAQVLEGLPNKNQQERKSSEQKRMFMSGGCLQVQHIGKSNGKRRGSGCIALQNNTSKANQLEKLEKYRQFLTKIGYANGISVDLVPTAEPKKLIYFIGKGNNSQLIRSLMKSRFWWIEGAVESANFLWTQLKKPDIFNRQEGLSNEATNEQSEPPRMLKHRPSYGDLSSATLLTCDNDKILCSVERADYVKSQPTKLLKRVQPSLVHNHMPGNCHLGNKKALFFNLRHYCQLTNKQLFDIMPLTFHIGQEYKAFQKQFKKRALQKESKNSNIWIAKPGENSNRGNGIHVISSMKELDELLASSRTHANGEKLTYIVQQYINRPFLYNRRKFDIRHYMLITSYGASLRAYWYREGYIRTSSQLFDLDDTKNTEIHLTNDAIQKYSESYGKYEEGNKLSYQEFQRYLDMHHKEKKYSFSDVLIKMREIATQAVRATYGKLDPQHHEFNFEIFGLDFMLDENFKPWLIEVNTNPCLELSSGLLSRIIPNMVEHVLRMSLDPLFPPPNDFTGNGRHYLAPRAQQFLKFQVMFNSQTDGPQLQQLYENCNRLQQPELGNIQEDDEEYHDEDREMPARQAERENYASPD